MEERNDFKTKHMITIELDMMEAVELAVAIRCRQNQIDRLFSITLEGDELLKPIYEKEKERLEGILQTIKAKYTYV